MKIILTKYYSYFDRCDDGEDEESTYRGNEIASDFASASKLITKIVDREEKRFNSCTDNEFAGRVKKVGSSETELASILADGKKHYVGSMRVQAGSELSLFEVYAQMK